MGFEVRPMILFIPALFSIITHELIMVYWIIWIHDSIKFGMIGELNGILYHPAGLPFDPLKMTPYFTSQKEITILMSIFFSNVELLIKM